MQGQDEDSKLERDLDEMVASAAKAKLRGSIADKTAALLATSGSAAAVGIDHEARDAYLIQQDLDAEHGAWEKYN